MFTKIIDAITKAFFFLASLALGLIVVIFSFEIIMRYFFAAPTSWATDTVTFLFCASLMLALPEVTRRLFETGINTLGSFRISKWIVFSFIPLGLGLSVLQLIILFKRQLIEISLVRKGA